VGEERKFATVLFADIVGSTAFGEAHDPEVVREALGRTFAGWRQIIAAHGGTTEKFIGDAVMAVFGVPMAHEDDPERAVRAAFALRERVRAEGDGAPFDIRIGVASGEVVSGGAEDGGQFLVTGPSVNLAARLQNAASPGEILVDPLTRKLSRHVIAFDPGRPIEAKGIGRVEANPAREITARLPSARPAFGELRAPLVGRIRELELLDTTYERVCEEKRPALLTVFGPAGIGKSRLIEDWIGRKGHTALVGRCLPYGEGITFWPVREMLHIESAITASDAREEVTAKVRAAVLRAFGEGDADADAVARRLSVLIGNLPASEAIPDVQSANVAAELRWAVRRYMERRATRKVERGSGSAGPSESARAERLAARERSEPTAIEQDALVVVFEDVQWAEPGLLDLIEHLAEWSRGPVLVVCLTRPELLDVRPGWGGGKTNAAAMTLEPLTYEDTRMLIGGLLGIPHPPTELVDDICPRADGNPLYVEEFLRTMIETARITRVEGEWLVTRGLPQMSAPPTLQGLMAARLDRVPAPVKRAMQHASVIGKRFSIEALSALAGAPVDEEVLADSVRRGLIHEIDERGLGGGRTYQFHHSLAREVAYAAVPKSERLRLHDGFGQWLEGAAGDRVGEYGETIAYHAEQAYRLARDLRSPRAVELGTRAFHALVAAATRARLRSDLTASTALYSRAAEIGDAIGLPMAERVEAEGFSALMGYYVEGTSEAVSRLDRVIDAARQAGPSEVLVRLLSQRGFICRTDDSADRFFEEGIAAARATGDPVLIAHAMTFSNAKPWARGDLVAHEVILREAYRFMKETGAKAELGICLVWLATNALQRGAFTEAERYLDEATAEANASGSKFQLWAVKRLAARAAIARAEHARAVRLANEAVALGHEVGAKRLIGLAYVRLGDALYEAGENAQARTILEQALQTIDRETMRETYVEVRWKLARAALATGDREAAFAHAMAAREAAWDIYSNATSAATLAAVRDAEGDRTGAEQLYKEALAGVVPTGFAQLRADIQRELARHYIRYGDATSADPLIRALVEFYRDPLAARRQEEAMALHRAAEASLPA
jgi:class 3 adenylate cyclase/tetratricopeptide (TPR) repeat protein